jgi:hypothetical protein
VPKDGALVKDGIKKKGEKAKREKGEKEKQVGVFFVAELCIYSLMRMMNVWGKGIKTLGFYPFRPFALKFFAVGPHMALSRYQKEGRCVR